MKRRGIGIECAQRYHQIETWKNAVTETTTCAIEGEMVDIEPSHLSSRFTLYTLVSKYL